MVQHRARPRQGPGGPARWGGPARLRAGRLQYHDDQERKNAMDSIRGLLRLVLPGAVLLALAATGAPALAGGPAEEAPNDATQARLRVSQCVYGEPEMDIYLNGRIPVDADIAMAVRQSDVTWYEYLAPGTHSLAVVPSGQDMSKALLGSLDVTLAAGHRYTVVALGQNDE